jgi:hypothetical protein
MTPCLCRRLIVIVPSTAFSDPLDPTKLESEKLQIGSSGTGAGTASRSHVGLCSKLLPIAVGAARGQPVEAADHVRESVPRSS